MSDFQDWEEFDPALLDQIAEEDPEYAAQLARQYKRAMTVLAREDPSWFCQYVLRHELTNGMIRQSAAHRAMQAAIQTQDRNLIWTYPGGGKALPLDTEVPTPTGWRNFGDLKPGDEVFASSGKVCTVLDCTPIQNGREVYEIVFDDGESVRADGEHQWLAYSRKDRFHHRTAQTVSTLEMLQTLAVEEGRANWALPLNGPVQFPDQKLPIHPYVFGAWLGDGNSSGPILTFARSDRWIYDRCSCLEGQLEQSWPIKGREHLMRGKLGGPDMRKRLAALGVLGRKGSKFIPDCYLNGSEWQRRELLAGLLDTDGSMDQKGRKFEFCSMQLCLAEGVLHLVQSLGVKATLRASNALLNGRIVGTRYRVCGTPQESLFFLPRKSQIQIDGKMPGSQGTLRYIKEIRRVPSVPVRCIRVSSPDQTFLIGRSFIVTHNCSATGTNVLLADGSWRTVETLREWTKVLTWDGVSPNLKVVTARATPNGRKPCVRVELENGVVLRVTENHPLMTGDLRWVQADQIKAGESVVTIRETAVPEPWNTPETPEAEIPGDEAEILGYLLAGRILGRGVIVRTLDKNEKWSERRKRLFEAAGWEFKKYGKRSLLVLPGTGVMAPADFLLSLVTVQHGWPVDVAGSVWRLPRVAHQRLLCGVLSMAFHGAGKDLMGRTVGVAGIRTPVGFLHPHRPTLELFRRLFLRSGAPARISDLVTKVRLPRGGGIWREVGTRPLYLFRLRNEDAGRFWPTKNCRYVEQLPWELTKVVKVTKTPPLETWAVEVQEAEHSYIAEGVLNHNTNQVAIGHVLWRLGKNPNQTIGILCNSGKMAAKILSALKTYVAESIELHDVFPNLKPGEKWAEYSFSVDRDTIRKDPSVQAIGLTGKFVGSRFDGLIMDDVDNVDTTLTQEARDRTEQLVRKQAISRLDQLSWAVAIGNVWHENDLMHRLEKTGWRPLKFQVMNPATGESNDPENFPLERIHQIRDVDQGPIEFQRLYQLQARQEGEQRCRQEWVDICLKKGNQQVLYRDGLEKIPAGCRTITGVDLGVKKKASSDPTAITSLLEIPLSGGRYEFQILNIRKGRWDAQEIMDKIAEEQKLFGSSVFVESNGCFVPGTRVLTPAGYKPIESVVPGDLVWTHKGRWRPVLERYDGTARHVTPARAKGVLPVRCTPNHWFWVRQAGRTPGRGGGHYRPVGDPGWCSIGFPDCEQYASLAVASWPACAPEIRLAATQKMNAKTLRIDENAALALGMFMAEGHTTDSHVYWTLNRTEGYLADLIDDGLGDLCAGTFRRRESRNTLRMVLGNKQIAAALHVGTRSNKCLPLSWMGWPLPLRIALVRGWLLGDGCIVANGNRKKLATRSISACTVSRNWALFVRTTLMQAGITVALRETHARKTSVIEGRTVNRSPMFLLNLTSDGSEALRTYMTHPAEAIRWGDSWWAHDEDRKKRQRRSGSPIMLDEMGAWSKIPKLDPDPTKTYQSYDDGPVHNLKVEEDESFTVEDFVVHNAQDLLVQLLQMSGRNIPVTAFHTGRNKFDPMFGVESIFGQMALGLWTFPSWEGTMDTVEAELEGLIQEMLAYTPGNHTGDVLMSLWIASEGARMSRATAAGKVEYGRLRLRR